MAIYYFDYVDGKDRHVDHQGMVLADDSEAADHATCLIGELLVENIEASATRSIAVLVRAQDGNAVYVAHGNIHGSLIADRRRPTILESLSGGTSIPSG